MIKKILVPVDGSDHAVKALRLACDLAEKYDVEIEIVNVAKRDVSEEYHGIYSNQLMSYIAVEYPNSETIPWEKISEDRGIRICRDVLDAVPTERKIESCILFGDPATKIVSHAKENNFDTIVMGSRGMSDIKGFFLGSVSHKVSSLFDGTCVTIK